MASQLWAKDLPLDALLHRFTVGDDPVRDRALLPWDALASAAHARTLGKEGHLGPEDVQSLVGALQELHTLALAGGLAILPEQEDGHTALEAALVARCGEAGKRIHLGRSRNDQVILALRLLVREALADLGQGVLACAQAFHAFAQAHGDAPLPGFTHLRKAMPSSFGLWGAAFAEGLLEELEALEALLQRLDACPGGAAAGFGTPLSYDRAFLAQLLGFSRVQRSPLDVMNSRGRHEGAVAAWLASLAGVLEKAFWDLSLYTLEDLGYLRLPDAFTTGSSIMPQKRNPDGIELGRAACRRLRGQAFQLQEQAGGLPSSYHRDHQLLKGPLLDMLQGAADLLAIVPRLVGGLEVDGARAAAACTDDLFAAHAATALAAQGLPFRDAYREVGAQVLSGTFHPDRSTMGTPTPDLVTLQVDLLGHQQALDARQATWRSCYARVWEGGLP